MHASAAHGEHGSGPPLLRRHAAIAFADVVGYSILTAADETATHQRWLAMFRDAIAPEATRQGGRIVDLRGDGVLAEFPDAAAALAWATGVHALSARAAEREPQLPPITFRIAVHVGSVLASVEGLFGDAVNLTARLQEFGAPGGTILSQEALVALPANAGAATRDLGELPMRNLSRAVRAFAIDGGVRAVPIPLPPPPARMPSVAVLPFENVGGDPADEYLAAGIVDDVINSLAGLHEVFVIARNSANLFGGQRPDPLRVGRTLGVRFVVTGRLQRARDKLRVSVQLADATTGMTVWGDRIDAAIDDIFDLQDHLVTQIVAGIAPNVRAASLREAMRKQPENLTAYELMLRGLHVLGALDRATFLAGRGYLLQAIDTDPNFALPLAWAARWHSLNIGQGWSTDREADANAALDFAGRAIASDGHNALALATQGHMLAFLRRDAATAMVHYRHALAASPNSSVAWTLASGALTYLGQGAEAVRHAQTGIRLSPYDPLRFSQQQFLAMAHYANGELDEAERRCQAAVGANPADAVNWRLLATVLAGLGRVGEAQAAGRRMLDIEPGFRLQPYVLLRMPFRDPALRERVERDLATAGMPA